MFSVILQDTTYSVEKNRGETRVNKQSITWDLKWMGDRKIHLIQGAQSLEAELLSIDLEAKTLQIRLGHKTTTLQLKDRFDLLLEKMGMNSAGSDSLKEIKAPMPGLILDLKVAPGDLVKKGDVVLILEAMKMENSIKSPGDGIVKAVNVSLKQSVEKNQVLIHPYPYMKYKRILLKLSGESLMGEKKYGIDSSILQQYAEEIKKVKDMGVEIAIVIGGGNIFRGVQAEKSGIDRVQGDYMGMLATLINAMALQSALEQIGLFTRLMSGIKIESVCEPFIRRRAIRHLEKGRIVIFGAGIGNPYFTTDSTAALRAIEIESDVVLKGTRVDGVYTADPEKDATATKYQNITFTEVYKKNLNVMDMTAFTLCQENNLPIIVFDMNKSENLVKLVQGEQIGTLITV